MNICPPEYFPYVQPDQEIIQLNNFDMMSPEMINTIKKQLPMFVDVVRVFEAQPKLPYKFPYSYDSPTTVQCDKLPKLPIGVTLPMIKTQYNKVAKKLGAEIPFPEVEYNYTMLYIILLLVLVVVVVAIYAIPQPSRQSKLSVQEQSPLMNYQSNEPQKQSKTGADGIYGY